MRLATPAVSITTACSKSGAESRHQNIQDWSPIFEGQGDEPHRACDFLTQSLCLTI